ncbi:MAG TPA: oligosaccharide flippase family protein [Gaiellaceae bacterium]|nr:oligosaccharide flippase family protein [Gaiellaceae bacterium]
MSEREATVEPRSASRVTGGSILRNSIRLLVSRAVAGGAAFVAVLTLARGLEPADRGAVAFVLTTGFVVAAISAFGFDQATTIFAARRASERRSLLANTLVVSIAGALVIATAVVLAFAAVSTFLPHSVGMVELAALGFGAVGSRVAMATVAYLNGCARFVAQAVASATPVALLAAAFVFLWLAGELTVRSACVAWAGSQIAGGCWGVVLAAHGEGISRPAFGLAREMLPFGLRAWPGTIAAFVNARIDQVVMGFIATEAALGYYVVAVNASDLALYVPSAAALAIVPSITVAPVAERALMTARIFRVLVVLTVGVVAVSALASPLVPVVFGAAYEPSVRPFLLLLPGAVAFVPLTIFGTALLASSAPGRGSVGPVAALVVGVPLDVLLIPAYGAEGAAIAASAAFTTGGLVTMALFVRLTRLDARSLTPRRRDVAEMARLVLCARRRDRRS